MRTVIGLLILALPNVSLAQDAKPFRYTPGEHGKGKLSYVHDVPVLILHGSPAEMGEQAGVLAVRQAKALFAFPRDLFRAECSREILRTNPTWTTQDAAFKLALTAAEQTLWPRLQAKAAALEANFPDAHRTELKAIATAAGKDVIGYEQLAVSNGLFDLGHVSGSELLRGCSSVIVPARHSATKNLLFGRNMDFFHYGYLHRYSLLTVYRPSDPKKHAFASAGFPGLAGSFTGINAVGLTIASHEVQDPNTTTRFNPKGVPFAMVYRRVLEECSTIGEAVKLLDSLERASVTSLVIADADGGAVIEVTPDAIAVRRFKDKPGVCTNHFCLLKNPNLKEQFNTFKRFEDLTKASTVTNDERFGVADLQQWLHIARLRDTDKTDLTIQTFVFEPATRTVHLRFSHDAGPATAGKLTKLELSKLWAK